MGYTCQKLVVYRCTFKTGRRAKLERRRRLIYNSVVGCGWWTSLGGDGGGTGADLANGIAVEGSNVYAAGDVASAGGTFGNRVVSSRGGYDCALWKLNSQGTTAWAVTGGGTAAEECRDVAVDSYSSSSTHTVIATGFSASSAATFGNVVLHNSGSGKNSFLWKLNPQGTTLWAVVAGAAGDQVHPHSTHSFIIHSDLRVTILMRSSLI